MQGEQLAGQVAIVTGAGSGIGEAIARRFVSEGARVAIAEISARRAHSVADALGHQALAMECDVSDPKQVKAAVETTVEAFGGLDIMVNNAATERTGFLSEVEPDHWQHTIAVNLGGVLAGIRYAAPMLTKRGGGSILNVSSIGSGRAIPGHGVYSATKAAVEALTRAAAVELRPSRIRVNALVPGVTRTPGTKRHAHSLDEGLRSDLDQYVRARQGRWADASEVAAAALHLVSDEASFTSGLLYVIDNANSVALG